MAKVTVYTTSYCPYCIRAKALLAQRGVKFEEIQISDEDAAAWDSLYAKSGMKTVPQIFADEKLVGGYTELATLDRQDQLKSLM